MFHMDFGWTGSNLTSAFSKEIGLIRASRLEERGYRTKAHILPLRTKFLQKEKFPENVFSDVF